MFQVLKVLEGTGRRTGRAGGTGGTGGRPAGTGGTGGRAGGGGGGKIGWEYKFGRRKGRTKDKAPTY